MKNVLDLSESNFKKSCIVDTNLRLKGCIYSIFSHMCCEEVSQIQETGPEWIIYARNLREIILNGLPYWLTGIFVFFKSYSKALQREKNKLNCILRLWS